MSKLFLIAGTCLLVTGLVLHFFPSAFDWFGRLPGDIRVENPGSRFYFPFTSMVLTSIVVSVIVNLFRHL